MKRLFTALALPAATAASLVAVQASLRRLIDPSAHIRLVPRDNLHLTVQFFGPTADAQVPAVCQALAAVAASHAAVSAELQKVATFGPPQRPRSIYAAVGTGTHALLALMAAVADACSFVGFAREKTRVPHVTLARVGKVRAPIGDVLAGQPDRVWGPVEGHTLVLYESHREPNGSRYEVLERFALRDRR